MKTKHNVAFCWTFGLMTFWVSLSFGQNFNVLCDKDNIIFGIPNTNEFVVIDHNNNYTIFPSKISQQLPEDLNISDDILQYRNIVKLNGSVYLIHNGGGEVIEFKDHEFTRIDNSFLHHNQYSSFPFGYNGSLYLFAGTGLFTTKNLLIKYDFPTGEWFKANTSGDIPPPGKFYFGLVIDTHFYVFFGDISSGTNSVDNKMVCRLDLTTMNWENIGEISDFDYLVNKGDNLLTDYKSFVSDNKLYFIMSNEFVEIDLLNNVVRRFQNTEELRSQVQNYINFLGSDEQYLYFQRCNAMRNLEDFKILKSDFTKLPLETMTFYVSSSKRIYNALGVIWISILLLVIILILADEFSFENKITIQTKSGLFTYRIKTIKTLSDVEKVILLTMAAENQISFSKIEDLCSDKNDSQDVRVKKREKTIKFIAAKLDGIFNNSEQANYFISNSNAEDKRIKSLQLNLYYFKIK